MLGLCQPPKLTRIKAWMSKICILDGKSDTYKVMQNYTRLAYYLTKDRIKKQKRNIANSHLILELQKKFPYLTLYRLTSSLE